MVVVQNTPFVFLSYAHGDREYVSHLRADLRSQGIGVWVDKEGIQAGTPDWEEDLRTALRSLAR